jgi:hypothetical protein
MIKVGDIVTWRHGRSNPKITARVWPMGVANCEVLGFEETPEGRKSAVIKLPPGLPLGRLKVLVADLEPDTEIAPKA